LSDESNLGLENIKNEFAFSNQNGFDLPEKNIKLEIKHLIGKGTTNTGTASTTGTAGDKSPGGLNLQLESASSESLKSMLLNLDKETQIVDTKLEKVISALKNLDSVSKLLLSI
ncbi:hypothetical protein BB560_004149, partial [Smittium megazygosporum]